MPLARGVDQFQAGSGAVDDVHAPVVVDAPVIDVPAVIIAIAASVEERVRVARLVSGHVPVLLVANREEAIAVLLAAEAESRMASPAPAAEMPAPPTPPTPESHGLDVDSDWRTANYDGRSVSLSPLEHDLLLCLVREFGHTIPFADLHRQVWGNDHLGDRSDVQSVVKRLRRKLSDLGSPFQIHAVRGVGLRLVDIGVRRPT